jgi:hypothetical protein
MAQYLSLSTPWGGRIQVGGKLPKSLTPDLALPRGGGKIFYARVVLVVRSSAIAFARAMKVRTF